MDEDVPGLLPPDESRRLAREVPDIAAEEVGDGIGDASDTDGEPIGGAGASAEEAAIHIVPDNPSAE